MNHRFTQKAQNAINAACNFAREFGHTYIGSEHLMLGLISEPDGIAAKLLDGLGVTCSQLKDAVTAITGTVTPTMVGADEMTPRAK
jgi:ATP-dependent Clp protease ATP-binding subunit ClpC